MRAVFGEHDFAGFNGYENTDGLSRESRQESGFSRGEGVEAVPQHQNGICSLLKNIMWD